MDSLEYARSACWHVRSNLSRVFTCFSSISLDEYTSLMQWPFIAYAVNISTVCSPPPHVTAAAHPPIEHYLLRTEREPQSDLQSTIVTLKHNILSFGIFASADSESALTRDAGSGRPPLDVKGTRSRHPRRNGDLTRRRTVRVVGHSRSAIRGISLRTRRAPSPTVFTDYTGYLGWKVPVSRRRCTTAPAGPIRVRVGTEFGTKERNGGR